MLFSAVLNPIPFLFRFRFCDLLESIFLELIPESKPKRIIKRIEKELIFDSQFLTCRMNQDSQFLILRNRHCTNKFSSVVCSKRLGAQKAHGNSYVQPATPSQWFNIISDLTQVHLIGNFIRIKSLIFLIQICVFLECL